MAENLTPQFYINSLPVFGDTILAPMDGFTDYPFRQIAHQFGSALSFSEFINAIDLAHGHPLLYQKLTFSEQERPVVLQIFDDDPQRMLEGAQKLEKLHPDIIDVNIGCSAKNVSNRGAGAGLLKDPQKIKQMVSSLVQTLKIPVTAKIRLGWDDSTLNYLEVSQILEDCGASMITVHGRTRKQEYSGTADWQAIREIKNRVKIPVIGNGDIKIPADIQQMKDETGCDAVMIGRAALGNPWILSKLNKNEIPAPEIYKVMSEHLALMISFYGNPLGVVLFRKHLARYLSGYLTTSEIRARIFQYDQTEPLLQMVSTLLSR